MTAAYQDSRGRKIQIVVIEAPASWYATTMKSWVLCSSLLAGATLALTPNVASACGGTFCDSGPTSMPVDQTGENILFVIDETHVEAHIQVQYDPDADADQFAWVIPVSVLPEFSVGSEALFQSLLSASVPRYGFNTTVDACEPVGDSGQGDGDGDGDPSGDGDGDPSGDGDGDPDPDPEIIFEGVVGAFEIAVLQGGTIAEIMQWLGDNGYQQDPNAEPILDSYLQEGFMFVALKLAMNTEVAAIHPIVLRYPGNEPCVPLRLTRIAAVEDMDVRVFMLGDARSAPSNYRHVLVNPLMIDWISFGGNYKEVVSMAVDAFAAEGNAFVTEYAGTSQIVNTSALANWAWNSAAFLELELTPENTMVVLQSQGLADCDGDVCTLRHPMLAPLLGEYLPVPANIDPALFYSCLSCFEGLIDLEAWDAAAFAADLDERIFEPGAHAVELIETWPYLTRMFTTISPNEMNVDPIFHENPDLPDVSNINFGARRLLCNGEGVFTLPDGRQVYLPNPNFWPTFDTQMPWEQAVQQVGMVGPGQLLSDRSETIEEVLSSWNALFGWPDGTGGDGDGTTDDPSSTDEGSACACSTSPSSAGALTAMFALLGLGFGVRRRDRSTS